MKDNLKMARGMGKESTTLEIQGLMLIGLKMS